MTLDANTNRAAEATLRGERKAEHSENRDRDSLHR